MLKKLSNLSEQQVFEQIQPTADRYAAHVYRKVRIADVVDIKFLEAKYSSYALKAHYDFVISDREHTPHFAIEFDGPGHTSQHDIMKDSICRAANLGLFRVDLPSTRSKIGDVSLVSYLLHLWFLGMKFKEMQAQGEIPGDEPFMISGFLKPNARHIFDSEFDLLSPARSQINCFCRKVGEPFPELAHLSLSELLLRKSSGEFLAFASYALGGTKLYGRSAVSLKMPAIGRLEEVDFARVEMGQYCTAAAIYDLVDQLELLYSGSGHAVRRYDEVVEEIETARQQGFGFCLAFYGGTDDQLARLAR